MYDETDVQVAEQQVETDFEAFYTEQLKPLLWHLARNGASRAEAEDVAQEAMLAVFRQWSSVTAPKTFVRTVAVRIMRRGWDNTKRDMHAHQRVARHEWIETFDANEDVDHLMALLTGLPPSQREVVVLDIEGYSTREIAEMTGQKAATVRSNVRHARAKLTAVIDTKQTRKEATDVP